MSSLCNDFTNNAEVWVCMISSITLTIMVYSHLFFLYSLTIDLPMIYYISYYYYVTLYPFEILMHSMKAKFEDDEMLNFLKCYYLFENCNFELPLPAI